MQKSPAFPSNPHQAALLSAAAAASRREKRIYLMGESRSTQKERESEKIPRAARERNQFLKCSPRERLSRPCVSTSVSSVCGCAYTSGCIILYASWSIFVDEKTTLFLFLRKKFSDKLQTHVASCSACYYYKLSRYSVRIAICSRLRCIVVNFITCTGETSDV